MVQPSPIAGKKVGARPVPSLFVLDKVWQNAFGEGILKGLQRQVGPQSPILIPGSFQKALHGKGPLMGNHRPVMLKEDLNVFISKKHVMYLVGVELDFHDGMDEKGFVFSNGVKE